MIRFSVGSDRSGRDRLILEVHSATGQLVRRLADQPAIPGAYEAVWDGRDERGLPAASGVYYYRLEAGDRIRSKRLVLVK